MSDTSLLNSYDDEPLDLEREPLDQLSPMERDWGGDGSDLHRPVRAHVLAALRPNTAPYPPPVDELMTLGDPRNEGVTERRHALGLAQEHLPDLLRMARDRGLYTANGDTDEVWAPLHAFYALEDLDVSAVVPEIIPLFDLQDDWLDTELPELFGGVGEPALEPLRAYQGDPSRWIFGRAHACHALQQIAEQHPDLREPVVAMLSSILGDAEHNDELINTYVMDALVELDAIEALPLIRHAFESGQVDEMVRGSWGDVLHDLGIEPEEGDPLLAESRRRFEERQERFFPAAQREEILQGLELFKARTQASLAPPAQTIQPAARDPRKATQEKARKNKNKRKAQSASRKANRRKGK